MAAEAFLLAAGDAERRRLRDLASSDRAALSAALKASGLAKMGVRLQVELLLRPMAADEAAANACVPTAVPEKPSGSFIGASAFVGARPGYVFKAGAKGLGYYADELAAFLHPEEARMRRGFTGNLSWLKEEPAVAAEEHAIVVAAPEAAAAPTPEASTLAPPGRLTEKRRAVLQVQAGPFAPELHNGKKTEVGHVVRIENRSWWALVEKIELHTFTCRDVQRGQVEKVGFQELQTTMLSLAQFAQAKAKWEARAPLAACTLRDDRKGHIHRSWTGPPPLEALRLTEKPAPGKGYYRGVVPSTPVLMPPRIEPVDVSAADQPAACTTADEGKQVSSSSSTSAGATTAAASSEAPLEKRSEYYYAHRRKIDFHVPTPAPQRID